MIVLNPPKRMACLLAIIGTFFIINAYAQVKVGAYYFDGWTGHYPIHITNALTTTFAGREPKWGWITSSQKIMDEQIGLASDAGLSFFDFCWYFGSLANHVAAGFGYSNQSRQHCMDCLGLDCIGDCGCYGVYY